jgi:hypothetical protein
MNRRQFEKHLRQHGCVLHHHGANARYLPYSGYTEAARNLEGTTVLGNL